MSQNASLRPAHALAWILVPALAPMLALAACDVDPAGDPGVESTADVTPAPAPMIEEPARPAEECPGQECRGTEPSAPPALRSFARTGKRSRGTNTQLAIPQNLQLADIDGDGYSDFIQYASNKLFVSKTDYAKTGMLHLYTGKPIKRVLTGDFHGLKFDQTCLITTDNTLSCYGPSTDKKDLWWWFSQPNFLADNEDAITGDFDGDGREDILVYPRNGGAFRFYSIKSSYYFTPSVALTAGNLNSATTGMRLRAGDFDGDGRDDLMLVTTSGQVVYYAAVFDGTNNTFWWGWSSAGGVVVSGDQVTTARIDDDKADDLVIHSQSLGSTRFFRMAYGLPPLNVKRGQIANTANSLLFWGAMHGPVAEPGNTTRDDAMVFELDTARFVRSDARWDGYDLTYWWTYTQVAPQNHTGWAATVSKPALVLKCKFSDWNTEPRNTAYYRDLVYSGLVGYWRDISYGTYDLSGSNVVDTWYPMGISSGTLFDRTTRAQRCMLAYPGSKSGYSNYLVFVNAEGDSGAAGNMAVVVPSMSNMTFIGHESAHTLGWDHSYDDYGVVYNDTYDIMSAMNVKAFAHPQFGTSGPEMNAPYKVKGGFIPAQRIAKLVPGAVDQTWRSSIAAVNRPEANGALMVRIGANDANYFTVEYRIPGGWDQGIPAATVLVHRVVDGTSYLWNSPGGVGNGETPAGSSKSFWYGSEYITVTVNSFATEGYTADVTVVY